jgi:hypothetical protein
MSIAISGEDQSLAHPLEDLATLSESCAHFAAECGCGCNSAFRGHRLQADRRRRRRDLRRSEEMKKNEMDYTNRKC